MRIAIQFQHVLWQVSVLCMGSKGMKEWEQFVVDAGDQDDAVSAAVDKMWEIHPDMDDEEDMIVCNARVMAETDGRYWDVLEPKVGTSVTALSVTPEVVSTEAFVEQTYEEAEEAAAEEAALEQKFFSASEATWENLSGHEEDDEEGLAPA